MSKSELSKITGKLKESASKPTQPAPAKIKGIFTCSSEISRSEKYELVLDRFRLYVNGKFYTDNVISACASDDYFVYVTRHGKLTAVFSDEKTAVLEGITAVQAVIHPAQPVILFSNTEGNIFEARISDDNIKTVVFTQHNATGSFCCRAYTQEDDPVLYHTTIYNDIKYFDPDKISAQECALQYLKNSGTFFAAFPDFNDYPPEMLDKVMKSRIQVIEFNTKMRCETDETIPINFNNGQSGWSNHREYIDYSVSFSVTAKKSGFSITDIKKLCDSIPSGFSSFYDYVYNKYL